MNQRNKGQIIILLLLPVILIFSFLYSSQKDNTEELELMNDNLRAETRELESNLKKVEDNLEEANGNIRDAKYSAWDDYYEMGYALDYLDEAY